MASTRSIREQKRQLIATLASCREGIRPPGAGLTSRIGPVRRLRSAVGGNPLKIFGFTFAGAALLTLIFRPRRRQHDPPKTPSNLAFRWLLGISQPAMKLWILHKAKEHFVHTTRSRSPEALPRS